MVHDNEVTVQVDIPDQPNITASPEKKLMMFVAIMAMLEFMASGLGMVKSLWGTVMLPRHYLGLITMMLFFEGIHVFCHSSKLVLHHMHNMHNMQQLFNPISYISCLFYWLELLSVITSGVLSAIGLAYPMHQVHNNMQHDLGQTEEKALVFYVFYGMAISEAVVFLAAKAIWKVSYCRLLEKVIDECGLGASEIGIGLINKFFYDVHYKCVAAGSITDDVLKMDLVTFAGEFLVSSVGEEQLMAATFLKVLSTHPHWSNSALGKIGTSKVVIDRLIQMINWENLFEENIRYSAAVIVSELAKKEKNLFEENIRNSAAVIVSELAEN